jgi:hypothetical protein
MLGRYLETRAKGRASQAIKRLITMGAKTASVLRDGQEVEVQVADLQPGQVMVRDRQFSAVEARTTGGPMIMPHEEHTRSASGQAREREVAAQFGTSYRRYADRVPAFVACLFSTTEDVA